MEVVLLTFFAATLILVWSDVNRSLASWCKVSLGEGVHSILRCCDTFQAFLYLASLLRYHGLKSNMPMLDFNLRYLSNGARYKKVVYKLYTSSNSTPFRTPLTKFETYNPIDVGKDRF